MWLTDLILKPDLQTHFVLVTRLLGRQRGHKSGLELFFVTRIYAQRTLKINTPFYKEAILAFSALDLQQHISTAHDLGQQNIHYNRIFTNVHNKTIPITPRSDREGHIRYADFRRENFKTSIHDPPDKPMTAIYHKIAHVNYNSKEHAIVTLTQGYLSFKKLTENMLYHELLFPMYRDHHSSPRWALYFPYPIEWEKIWHNCHNILATETTKTVVWEQIHLNFFTQYCHNKGSGAKDNCPLCHTIPTARHHVILSCPFTLRLFSEIQPYLNLIHPGAVNEYEMAFGINGNTPSIVLRNWITFKLRQCISRQEWIASKHPLANHALQVKKRLNSQFRREIVHKYHYCELHHRTDFFIKHYQFTNSVVRITPDEIDTADVFTL